MDSPAILEHVVLQMWHLQSTACATHYDNAIQSEACSSGPEINNMRRLSAADRPSSRLIPLRRSKAVAMMNQFAILSCMSSLRPLRLCDLLFWPLAKLSRLYAYSASWHRLRGLRRHRHEPGDRPVVGFPGLLASSVVLFFLLFSVANPHTSSSLAQTQGRQANG